MELFEQVNKLAEKAILLDPGNLSGCGEMLILLESIYYPGIEEEKNRLQGYLEAMIMNDIEGEAPEVDDIAASVEKMQNIIRGDNNKGGNYGDSQEDFVSVSDKNETEKKQPKAKPKPKETIQLETDEVNNEDIELLMDFIAEAREHLGSIEINMVDWEKNPHEKEIINSIFRPFHTIKGVAGFLNLTAVNKLSHQLENLLDEVREGRIQLTPDLSDLIFDGVDVLKSMISTHETAAQSNQPQKYTVDIEAFLQRISMFLNAPQKVPEEPQQPIGEILVSEGKIKEEELDEVLEKQKSLEVSKPLGEMLVEENKVTAREVRDAVRQQTGTMKPTGEKHIKVDTHKMDQLLDMVGELVISQSMVTHNPEVKKITDQRFVRDISQLTRVTSTLQTISMSMRLVPIGVTFQKMNRIVRDLAKKSGKKINLVIEGQSAEIDRNMVEELYDPLVHMIRNSCDHGIKTPEERAAKGKPEEGTIVLKAEHGGGKIVITITDDGDGLDRESILAKAREKGIVGADEQPDDKTIDNMIIMAGFSTAKQITDVSGRGVGMDVVKKAIEKLHGDMDISSRPGEGSTFSIKLPLTTAIIDGMLVQLGSERYIIPTLSVRQLVHPRREDINTIVGKGETVMVRGKLLPLIKLHKILEIKSNKTDPSEAVLVIIEDSGQVVALQVDSVVGKQEVVIKSIGSAIDQTKCVAGAAILGDGRVGLILDVRSVVNFNETTAAIV